MTSIVRVVRSVAAGNRLVPLRFISLLCIVACGGSSPPLRPTEPPARLRLGATDCSVGVELRSAHPFLAEYDRRVHLDCVGDAVATADLGRDHGGHTTVNVYRVSDSLYALHCFSGVMLVDAKRRLLSVLPNHEAREQPTSGSVQFVGAFDFGEQDGAWRFIPASERAEQKVEIIKGG
jgi:hypothetical protein